MLSLWALVAASAVQCPVESAQYVLRDDPDISAYFRRVEGGPHWPNGVALAIHSRSSGETSWWLPWNGGTNNLQNITSTTDVTASDWRPPSPDGGPRPHGNREYLGFDEGYNVINAVPRSGQSAPAHILIPNSGGSNDRIFPSKQFFDLVSCSGVGS
jgi:hypothetical protein